MKDKRTSSEDHLAGVPQEDHEDQSRVIPVFEEFVHLDKKVIETGKVTISKKTVEHEETVDEMFRFDEVQVERVEINEYVKSDQPPGIRHEGDTMIVPVLKEVLVVEKRLLLVEELHIIKKQIEKPYHTKVTLRKEEVTINRTDPDPAAPLSGNE